MLSKYYYLFLVFLSTIACKNGKLDIQKPYIVKSLQEYNDALKQLQPGDSLVLAKGIWKDAELVFEGNGTKEKPITLTVEELGQTWLTGQSNLRISGEHLIIKGLVFKDGYTPTSEVISFKKDNEHYASYTRLTECVIDNYSNPERREQDYWIGVYGKHNRIDHNHIEGKGNLGVTLAVRLNAKEFVNNYHSIDHNYFGPRQMLGSNGGETLRIGTSHHSLSNSNTTVAFNYFDRCSGELEIISNKSCQNTYKNNVFFESRGTLTMRHGNETLVENNVFIGNRVTNTGGIRVINEKQTIRNNYMTDLTGYRFSGALVVMNGVPNSPLNRYFQVTDALIENNTLINCDHIQLCAGSDQERSATPVHTTIKDNIFYHNTKDSIFTVYDDISGIDFKNNLLSPNLRSIQKDGFHKKEFDFITQDSGLMVLKDTTMAGASVYPDMLTRDSVGVSWYPKRKQKINFDSGKTIEVVEGLNTIVDAVNNSLPGDILKLASGKSYIVTKTIKVKHPLTIITAAEKARITFERQSLFSIENGGDLKLKNIVFDGSKAPDYSGNTVISTSKYSMNKNYTLLVEDCAFENLNINHSFDAIKVYKNTVADTISIENSTFTNITGDVLGLDKEIGENGIFNAEFVIVNNNTFSNIDGAVLNLVRDGKDESTFGPFLTFEKNKLENVGYGSRNKNKKSMTLLGVQNTVIADNTFINSKGIQMHLVVGGPVAKIHHNSFIKTEKPIITGTEPYQLLDNSYSNVITFDSLIYKIDKPVVMIPETSQHLSLGTVN